MSGYLIAGLFVRVGVCMFACVSNVIAIWYVLRCCLSFEGLSPVVCDRIVPPIVDRLCVSLVVCLVSLFARLTVCLFACLCVYLCACLLV